MVRFVTLIIKSLLLIVVGSKPPFKRKEQLYNLVEHLAHVYRNLVPIPVWFVYLMAETTSNENITTTIASTSTLSNDSPNDFSNASWLASSNTIFACTITALYLAFKLVHLYQKLNTLYCLLRAYMLREVEYGGNYATNQQILDAETAKQCCPICQQDKITVPIILPCSHLFCEECLSQWFQRENTCPVCRAVVKTAGNKNLNLMVFF